MKKASHGFLSALVRQERHRRNAVTERSYPYVQSSVYHYLKALNDEARAKRRKARLVKHAKRHAEKEPHVKVWLKRLAIR